MTTAPAGQSRFDVVVLGTGGRAGGRPGRRRGWALGRVVREGRPGWRHERLSRRGMLGTVQRADGRQRMADSRDDALRYLASLSFGHVRPGFAEAFVDEGPRVFGRLELAAALRMRIVSIAGFPGYHPETAQAAKSRRRPDAGMPALFSFRRARPRGPTAWRPSHRSPHRRAERSRTPRGGTRRSAGRRSRLTSWPGCRVNDELRCRSGPGRPARSRPASTAGVEPRHRHARDPGRRHRPTGPGSPASVIESAGRPGRSSAPAAGRRASRPAASSGIPDSFAASCAGR